MKELTPQHTKEYYAVKDVLTIEFCIKNNFPVLLVGETGVGKTTLIKALADEAGEQLIRVSMNGSMGTEELLGKRLLEDGETIWQDGILTNAVRNGSWIVLDEINSASAEILFALHALLDHERALVLPEKDNERIPAHKNFRMFAGMNPEEYVGTKLLNQAFKSRFYMVNILPLEASKEITLLTEKISISEEEATKLVSIGAALRKMKQEQRIVYFCSTRDLEMAGELMSVLPFSDAVVYAIFNKMGALDLEECSGEADVKRFIKDNEDTLKEQIKELRRLEKEAEGWKDLKLKKIKLEAEVETLEMKHKAAKEANSSLAAMQEDEIFLKIKKMQSDPLFLKELKGVDPKQFSSLLLTLIKNSKS